MTFFLTMFPFYLMGNFHCLGMCGPLAILMGGQRYRYLYFFGRIFSFSLVGLVSGGFGAVLHLALERYHIGFLLAVVMGGIFIIAGCSYIFRIDIPGNGLLSRWLQPISVRMTRYILKENPWSFFLFGIFTVALPCGQTLLVFSACALNGSAWEGYLNGVAFAMITTPSLYFASHIHQIFRRAGKYYGIIIGGISLCVGILMASRAFANEGWIPHLTISERYHIVMF